VFIMVDEPVGNKKSYGFATAGWVAAPAAGRVVAAMAPLLGMKPSQNEEEDDIAYPLLPYVKDRKKAGGQHASVTTE
jgi:cell division protein FtsI (penicillin-binding protein 3)